jgi:hypothetical protein
VQTAKDVELATTLCARCGHEGRLIMRSSNGTVSRCYVCGDETLNLRAGPSQLVRDSLAAPASGRAASDL